MQGVPLRHRGFDGSGGVLGTQLLYREGENSITVLQNHLPWSFDADPVHMSTKLDNTRVNRDINNFISEIIQRLEVEVTAENGIPSTTIRTVSENCRTLKVSDFGFDG